MAVLLRNAEPREAQRLFILLMLYLLLLSYGFNFLYAAGAFLVRRR